MGLLDVVTGGASKKANKAQQRALEALGSVNLPTLDQLTLPELQQYAVAANMSPAEMQAFLQQSNAFNDENINQAGTDAQIQALNQLASVANAGAEGNATQKAQVEQINQDAARNLAGQRGAIDQQAQSRGVSPGMLQAALQSQRAGEGQQDAHMAALQAQGQNYQQALQAMAQGGALGGQLQGQQNTQANTVAQAQNAMQQFNAANQQNAAAQNAQNQQASNLYNTQAKNQVGSANTGLANQRTQYNAGLPQQMFGNAMQKATGQANQYNQMANQYTGQGQQNAGIFSGLLGAAGTAVGSLGGPAGAVAGGQMGKSIGGGASTPTDQNQYMPPRYAHGGMVGCADGAVVPGDSPMNDTVPAMLSPGEAVIPRSQVQQNPTEVMALLAGQGPTPSVDPSDVATILKAMKMLRGAI